MRIVDEFAFVVLQQTRVWRKRILAGNNATSDEEIEITVSVIIRGSDGAATVKVVWQKIVSGFGEFAFAIIQIDSVLQNLGVTVALDPATDDIQIKVSIGVHIQPKSAHILGSLIGLSG